MHAFASQYSADLAARGIAFGKTRIGVHTGEVIVGNFGGTTMFDYRALGDPVNTAARLEGANKYTGARISVFASASRALPPKGTTRSLAPLPKTRIKPCSRSTCSNSSDASSETRMPLE